MTAYYEGVAARMIGLGRSNNPYRKVMRLQWSKGREVPRFLHVLASSWDGGHEAAVSISPSTEDRNGSELQ